MDSINAANQANSINPNLTNQKRRFSLKSVTIISTLFALISSPFISLSNSFIIFSILGLEPKGAFGLIGEFLLIGILSSFIWIPAFILSARDAYHGSRTAKLILIIMLIYFPIAGGLISYEVHLSDVELEKFRQEKIISTYNQDVEMDVEYYRRAAINYCYYTGHLPKTLEEISSLPQLSGFQLRKIGPTTSSFGDNYYYDPKISYNPKVDGTGFSVNGTFRDGREYKKSFDIPTSGCMTITPFPYL